MSAEAPLPAVVAAALPALRDAAVHAASRAHAPYSRFRVGAALLGRSGAIYAGCNVENASYGGTVCAERNAVAAAVLAGETAWEACVVYTPTPNPAAPCGMCRQVLSEFAPHLVIVSTCDGDAQIVTRLDALLPHQFVFTPPE
jgi:cytidine deaminase